MGIKFKLSKMNKFKRSAVQHYMYGQQQYMIHFNTC